MGSGANSNHRNNSRIDQSDDHRLFVMKPEYDGEISAPSSDKFFNDSGIDG